MLDTDTITSLALLILSLSVLGFFLVGEFYLQPTIPQGSSMEPTLHEGQMAFFLRNFDAEKIPVGSVISYEFNKTLTICHRVVSKGADDRGIFYIAKGDNNTVQDPWLVRPEQVRGILIFEQPFYLSLSLIISGLFFPAGLFFCSITVLNKIKSRGLMETTVQTEAA